MAGLVRQIANLESSTPNQIRVNSQEKIMSTLLARVERAVVDKYIGVCLVVPYNLNDFAISG